jgi:hypothetical protein
MPKKHKRPSHEDSLARDLEMPGAILESDGKGHLSHLVDRMTRSLHDTG